MVRYIDELWCLDKVKETSTFDEDAIQDWDKQMLRDALSAVGHPTCKLTTTLAAMTDYIGISLALNPLTAVKSCRTVYY